MFRAAAAAVSASNSEISPTAATNLNCSIAVPSTSNVNVASAYVNEASTSISPASQLASSEFTEAGHGDTNGQAEPSPSTRGQLLATPPLLVRNSSPSKGSLFSSLHGNAPFALRTSSNSAVSRDRHRDSGPRGKEVVIYSSAQEQNEIARIDDNILTEEELFNFNVENNTYAALVLEEEGIADDDISEQHNEPFDDHNVNPAPPLRMPSQTTRILGSGMTYGAQANLYGRYLKQGILSISVRLLKKFGQAFGSLSRASHYREGYAVCEGDRNHRTGGQFRLISGHKHHSRPK
ncbi:hypothetical protein IFM89_037947 [Coptis chinensis]|uniref:Uncharacterized protein n=1 Tax=Coptis chinensis TaxID=261450 RepID=A0A835HT49_9MAGN|nr:hypothetical protein IFM89_037947 [Coptis chinensis]